MIPTNRMQTKMAAELRRSLNVRQVDVGSVRFEAGSNGPDGEALPGPLRQLKRKPSSSSPYKQRIMHSRARPPARAQSCRSCLSPRYPVRP